MNFDILQTKDLAELKTLAVQTGTPFHHKSGKDKLIKAIIEHAVAPKANQFKTEDMTPKAMKPVAPEYSYTEQDVREACAASFAKGNFSAQFMGDGTVIFKCNGAEESLNLNQPMKVIKRRAEIVARGRLAVLQRPEFGSMNATGKNAYTDTVLA